MPEPDPTEPQPTQPWSGPAGAPSPVTPGSAAGAEPRRSGWQPPDPEQLQASFPLYEIRRVLGRGGMGAVYQGWQKSLDRLVAIKILPPGLEDNGANFAERFQREAKAMARFSHPGIVAVYDAGETADGLFYFVMEYIEGTDVQKMVRENGPLPPEHALAITAHVCDALAYAHKRGVIHRDIKPANIMVDTEGQVKVADFGLAKVATDDSAALVTGSHVSMGTADFMAPEALYGMGNVDHRADLYAVGVMLYQMLTGEVPRGRFDLPSVARPGIDARFDAIVDRAMQKNPERRYASATEIRTDLDKILTEPIPHRSAAQPTPPAAPAPQARVQVETPAPRSPAKAKERSPAQRATAAKMGRSRFLATLLPALAVMAVVFGLAAFFLTKAKKEPQVTDEIERIKQSIPPLEPAASATPLEPGAIRLWDSPEKVPKGDKGVSWKDDALFLHTYGRVFAKQNGRDLKPRDFAFRFTFRSTRDDRYPYPALLFRNTGSAEKPTHYALDLNPRDGHIDLNRRMDGKSDLIRRWKLPNPILDEASMRIKLRAVGDAITLTVDGKPLETVRDTMLPGPGLIVLAGKSNCYFRDIVYVPMDKPETTVSTPAAPTEIRTFGGHRYQLVRDPINWPTAKTRAEEMGGHLATVTTNEENGFLRKEFFAALKPDQGFWIGGKPTARGTFRWITGEPFTLQAWLPGKPERKGDFDQSLAMRYFRTREPEYFAWDDVVGSALPNVIGFLVEWDDDGGKPAENWVRVLDRPEDHPATGRTQLVNGWIVPRPNAGASGRTFGDELSDGAVRMDIRWAADSRPELALRVANGGMYRLVARDQPWQFLLEAVPVGTDLGKSYQGTKLGEYRAAGYHTNDIFQLELRAVGHTLTVKLDGKEIIRAEDGTLTSGRARFMTGLGGLRNVEVLNLDQSGAVPSAPGASAIPVGGSTVSPTPPAPGALGESALPGTATKEAPFVNSLGMKFVPVPITGGPTGGQWVLFSVWETLMQDVETFAKETKNERLIAAIGNKARSGPDWVSNWEEATAFCVWLTERERQAGKLGAKERYRLPSDHEWSCAVGIGDREDPAQTPAEKSKKLENVFPWGSAWPPPVGTGNFAGEEVRELVGKEDFAIDGFIAGYTDAYKFQSPPGSFPANGLGLYDLDGNVPEMCEDWMDGTKRFRVMRGGSYRSSSPANLDSSRRASTSPTSGSRDKRFRIVLAPVAPGAAAAAPREAGAVRVWDSPETIPQGVPGISWKDGALFMEKQTRGLPNSTGRDSIVRFAARMGTGGWASVTVRDSGCPTAPRYYQLWINPGLGTIELKGANTGPLQLVKKWPLVRDDKAGEWMQVELRTVGDEFTVSINGQRLEPVRDTTLNYPGFTALAGLCSFRNILYVPLDPPPAATPALATKDAPFRNTLGQEFVPVPGTVSLFCRWETRVNDYGKFADAVKTVDPAWTKQEKDGVPVSHRAPEYFHYPVVGTSWDDANAFCAWLTKKELAEGKLPPGTKYRLPTDEEWSRAVGLAKEDGVTPRERGSKNQTQFPWGREYPPETKVGNYADTAFREKFPHDTAPAIEGYTDGFATTAPVGSFPPNPFGIYDLGGNAIEWCEDWLEAGVNRVARGAGWTSSSRGALVASFRAGYGTNYRYPHLGFRVVVTPAATLSAP